MKLYKTKHGIIIEKDKLFYLLKNENWDIFINDDDLYTKLVKIIQTNNPDSEAEILVRSEIEAPIEKQELWASGVTYMRSKIGRQSESKNSGGGDFYARVYEAERPELFFKANRHRIADPFGKVRIRKDSTWDVPEPELTLVITSSGKIIGYTIGNDMSSRSIEGENPLYLPQAKTYDGCASIGPCIFVTEEPLSGDTIIQLQVKRGKGIVFEGEVAINQIKRSFKELVNFLYRESSFPYGSMLLTGTGIVPSNEFTLCSGDEIIITIEPVGTLINTVE